MPAHQTPSPFTPTVRRIAVDRSARLPHRPVWVSVAAAVWSLLYSLLGLYWTVGGTGFPFGTAHDPHAARVSILEHVQPDTAAPVIAGLGFMSTVLAIVMVRTRLGAYPRRAAIGLGWTLAVTLAVVIPDHRLLMAVARTPIVLIGLPFGWPDEMNMFGPGMYAWPVLNQLFILLGGVLWAATTVAYQNRGHNACATCGRTDAMTGWTTPQSAARWGRYAVAVAVIVPLLYAVTRWAWALGLPLGVTREFLREEARDTPDIWLAGAILASVAAGGACLTLGLVQRWGEVYPRWIPILGGRAVRLGIAIVPAALVAVLVMNAGVYAIRAQVLGYYPENSGLGEANWGTTAPGLLWPLWGAALGAATLAYYLRRRGACASCGRGSDGPPNHALGRKHPQRGHSQHELSRSSETRL
jgi:hypothetical protein